jgi:hypothetical protein
MKRKSFLIFACFTLALFSLSAAGMAQEVQSKYDVLLAKVKAGDQAADFQELRFAYTETPQYNPYGGVKVDYGKQMFDAYKAGQNDKALEYAATILKDNFVDIDAHMLSAMVYKKTGNAEKEKYHRFITSSLIKSIMKSGDGLKPETAFWVITVNEEYVLLQALGLKFEAQSKISLNGHDYDKIKVTDPETGKKLEIYFCIDKPFQWLGKSMKK